MGLFPVGEQSERSAGTARIVAGIGLRIYARVWQLRDGMRDVLAFLGISLVVIVTPGQDTALTIRNTLQAGRANGVKTATGVASGQLVWALAASTGLAALLAASEPAFNALKLAGAAYLIMLGLQALRDAIRGHAPHDKEPKTPTEHGFRQGLISNLGNPKMAVFFTGLLPQFAPDQGPAFATMLALGVVFAALTLAWLTLYATAVDTARAALQRPAVRRALDAVTGTALIALGVRVAAER
jgi:threonine/homoserine/homoserine lactone efflux protein